MDLQLRKLREKKHLTQTDLANELTTTLRKISAWERGETSMPLEDACAAADYFGVTLDELAGRWEYVSQIPSATADELEIIDAYRSTDERGQRSIQRAAQGAVEDFERGSSVETVKDPAGIDRTA